VRAYYKGANFLFYLQQQWWPVYTACYKPSWDGLSSLLLQILSYGATTTIRTYLLMVNTCHSACLSHITCSLSVRYITYRLSVWPLHLPPLRTVSLSFSLPHAFSYAACHYCLHVPYLLWILEDTLVTALSVFTPVPAGVHQA